MPREREHREHSSVSHDTTGAGARNPPTKRKHRDISDDTTGSNAPVKKKIQLGASSGTQNRNEQTQPHRSVNDLKRRIRDVKRLLTRGDLPPDARIVQERALAGYEKDLEDETQKRARSQMIKKYHFVRFLDRKSATKNLNRLLRREKDLVAAGSEQVESLREKIHVARVNLNYTIYYPLNDKYISLYADEHKQKQETDPDSQNEDSNPDTGARAGADKPAMWFTIEKCMQEGTLDRLREGKLGGTQAKDTTKTEKKDRNGKTSKDGKMARQDVKKSKPTARTTSKVSEYDNRRERRAKGASSMRRDAPPDDDGSDGGFFE